MKIENSSKIYSGTSPINKIYYNGNVIYQRKYIYLKGVTIKIYGLSFMPDIEIRDFISSTSDEISGTIRIGTVFEKNFKTGDAVAFRLNDRLSNMQKIEFTLNSIYKTSDAYIRDLARYGLHDNGVNYFTFNDKGEVIEYRRG